MANCRMLPDLLIRSGVVLLRSASFLCSSDSLFSESLNICFHWLIRRHWHYRELGSIARWDEMRRVILLGAKQRSVFLRFPPLVDH